MKFRAQWRNVDSGISYPFQCGLRACVADDCNGVLVRVQTARPISTDGIAGRREGRLARDGQNGDMPTGGLLGHSSKRHEGSNPSVSRASRIH